MLSVDPLDLLLEQWELEKAIWGALRKWRPFAFVLRPVYRRRMRSWARALDESIKDFFLPEMVGEEEDPEVRRTNYARLQKAFGEALDCSEEKWRW